MKDDSITPDDRMLMVTLLSTWQISNNNSIMNLLRLPRKLLLELLLTVLRLGDLRRGLVRPQWLRRVHPSTA